jgi:hypothetical protein
MFSEKRGNHTEEGSRLMRLGNTSDYLVSFNSAKSYTESTKLVVFLLKYLTNMGDIRSGKERVELLVSAFMIKHYDQWAQFEKSSHIPVNVASDQEKSHSGKKFEGHEAANEAVEQDFETNENGWKPCNHSETRIVLTQDINESQFKVIDVIF